ncbi:MAG TPA: hypothetical protein VL563_05485, partial [Gemmatimonadales bacterium]|nr:hypothetical protein [Gemmatimonadales bacterium]
MIRWLMKGAFAVPLGMLLFGTAPAAARATIPASTRLTGAIVSSGSTTLAVTTYRAAYRTLLLHRATTIPAFARKYSLACSACHTVWPELNAFGQRFKDNGYQLGNDRDSPIWQSNGYWPIAMRTTPNVHIESTTKQLVD